MQVAQTTFLTVAIISGLLHSSSASHHHVCLFICLFVAPPPPSDCDPVKQHEGQFS